MKLPFQKLRAKDHGQAILIIALAMVGVVAFVGMMVDGGVLFIEYGKLKKGIDAAAIASAQQFRKGFQGSDLSSAAQNFLTLNGTSATINVYRCGRTKDGSGNYTVDMPTDGNGYLLNQSNAGDGTKPDNNLCPQADEPIRKLVRVEAEKWVDFRFLRVIGINGMTIRADSVGEAASVDLVLAIDTSASMAYDTYQGANARPGLNTTDGANNSTGTPIDDENPAFCNDPSNNKPCQPLTYIKGVADDFIDTMYFPYDRVSVVAFTGQEDVNNDGIIERSPIPVLPLSDDESDVRAAIASLKVFQPPTCDWSVSPAFPQYGPCINYNDSGDFIGMDCPRLRVGDDQTLGTADDGDPSSCNSSNIGGALDRAASEFTRDPVRPDAFWVIIMLAGGPANATDSPNNTYPFGYCPKSTWLGNPDGNPFCRDALNGTRHDTDDRDADNNYLYDADDFARDKADNLITNDLVAFTIGWGDLITQAPSGDPDSAEELLKYIASKSGAPEDFYFFADDANALANIFEKISDNIRTRIAK